MRLSALSAVVDQVGVAFPIDRFDPVRVLFRANCRPLFPDYESNRLIRTLRIRFLDTVCYSALPDH
jgi:hypothetical protein